MKKIILILAIFASIGLAAQGTLRMDNIEISTIPQYDVSGGDKTWTFDLRNPSHSFKWGFAIDFNSLVGTLDGTLVVTQSFDEGTTWIAYPEMATQTVAASQAYSFEDLYTTADNIKVTLTVNSISAGTADVNIRLFTNPQ